MSKCFVKRGNRNIILLYGGSCFVYSMMLLSFGVMLFVYCASVTQIMVKNYENKWNKVNGVLIAKSKVLNEPKVVPQPEYYLRNQPFDRHLLSVSQAEEGVNQGIIDFKENIPRYNFKGQRVSNKFDPTNPNYYESLIVMMIPCVAIGILSCFLGSCFFLCRCCCGLCGGRKPKEGGYSIKERYIPKQLLLAIGLTIVTVCIFGFIGNSDFSSGLNQFFDVIENSTETVLNTTSRVIFLLESINVSSTSVQNSLQPLETGTQEFQNTASEAQYYIDESDKIRLAIIDFGYIVSLISAAMGIIGSLLNKGFPCMLMALSGVVSLTFVWISFGFHLPVSILLADMCVSISNFVNNSTTTNLGGLSIILECLQNSSYSPALNFSSTGANNALSQLNNFTMACCNISYTQDNISTLNLTIFPPQLRPSIQNDLNEYEDFLQIIDELGIFLNCSFVRNAFDEMENALCVTMLNSVDTIMATQGLIGIILIPGFYLAVLSWKRLPNPRVRTRQPYHQDLNEGSEQENEELDEHGPSNNQPKPNQTEYPPMPSYEQPSENQVEPPPYGQHISIYQQDETFLVPPRYSAPPLEEPPSNFQPLY